MGLQIRPIVNKNIPQMWSIIVICCDSIFLKKYKVKDYKKNHLRFWPFLWNNTQSMGEIIYVIMPKVRYLICWPWHVTIATWRRFKQLIRPNELQIIFVYICWCAILAWWGAIDFFKNIESQQITIIDHIWGIFLLTIGRICKPMPFVRSSIFY
jgi:hypothetical protein